MMTEINEIVEQTTPIQQVADVTEDVRIAESAREELYPGDSGTLSLALRKLLVTLLKGPYLYREKRKDAWNLLINNMAAVRTQLSNLLLDLVVDDELGVAYVCKPNLEEIEAPSLLNQYAFKFLDSVLLIEMRDRLMRAQQGGERAVISLDEINTHLGVFESSARTDTSLFAKRVDAVIKRMKERHLLIELGKNADSFEVSPVIKTVFDAAQVDTLREAYLNHIEKARRAAEILAQVDEQEKADV